MTLNPYNAKIPFGLDWFLDVAVPNLSISDQSRPRTPLNQALDPISAAVFDRSMHTYLMPVELNLMPHLFYSEDQIHIIPPVKP